MSSKGFIAIDEHALRYMKIAARQVAGGIGGGEGRL